MTIGSKVECLRQRKIKISERKRKFWEKKDISPQIRRTFGGWGGGGVVEDKGSYDQGIYYQTLGQSMILQRKERVTRERDRTSTTLSPTMKGDRLKGLPTPKNHRKENREEGKQIPIPSPISG